MIKYSPILLMLAIYGSMMGDQVEPLKLGNLSVPTVTQISPLISFGQNIIDERSLLLQWSELYAQGYNHYSNFMAPNVIYGIRNDLSVYFVVPVNPISRSGSSHSSGLEDIFLQLEYAFYSCCSSDAILQATIVGNVQFPTGSSKKKPRTGNGWFTYFLGTTLSYTSADWYAFVSPGINFMAPHQRTKFGNAYLYQWGFARYIKQLSPPGCVFDLMLELDGIYMAQDTIDGVRDPNSGGNTLLITPSIWLSSKTWLVQWGVSAPLVQDLHGQQDKIDFGISYTLGWAFQF